LLEISGSHSNIISLSLR